MPQVLHVGRRFAAVAIACFVAAACSHSDNANGGGTAGGGGQGLNGALGQSQQNVGATTRPLHPSDGYRLAEIAVARLGGSAAPAGMRVTGVSVVDNYGLTVYEIGSATQELLSIKENGNWRPLGTDAFVPNGRGLVHFGLSQDLANRLIEALAPPPGS